MRDSLLRPIDVGRLFGVEPKTVTRWEKEGLLRSVRTPGGHRRYPVDQVRALLAKCGRPDETTNPGGLVNGVETAVPAGVVLLRPDGGSR